mgnify:CR=1 FL=1
MAGQYGYEDEQRLADEGWEPVDENVCALFMPPMCASLGCIFPGRREETVCEADVTTSKDAQIGAMWEEYEYKMSVYEMQARFDADYAYAEEQYLAND